jgi:hypothetical protein
MSRTIGFLTVDHFVGIVAHDDIGRYGRRR